MEQLKAEAIHVHKRFWNTQAPYKWHFDARLRCKKDKISPEDFNDVKNTMNDKPHNLVPVANSPFLVVAVDSYTVTIQRPDNSVGNIFRNRVVKTTTHVQIRFQNLRALIMIILVFWIYQLVVILARSLHTAPLLRKGVRTACLPNSTTRPRRCVMLNTFVLQIVLNSQNNPNVSSPKLMTDRNKRR